MGRVADCSTVTSFVDPATYDGQQIEPAFSFARDMALPEVLQLALEIEAHRWSDARASKPLASGREGYLVAWGADEVDPGAIVVTCAYRPVHGGSRVDERRYTFDSERRVLDYQEVSHPTR